MAELIDRKPIIKRVKRFAEYEWNGSRKQAYMEFLDMLTDAPTITEAEIRAKAIDEFAEKISLEISESIIWGMVVTAHRDGNCSETSDEIVDYVIDTAKSVAEQLKEE